jgi:ubiquinone/menaquinone biosynthesis C-methylase UbiE
MKSETEHIQLNVARWDRWAKSYDGNSWRYRYLRRAQRVVISLLDAREGISFLDVDCGTGRAVGQVAKLVNDHGTFYGVDLLYRMIEKAKENFKDSDNFYFIKSNAESIPLRDNLFDIIICTNSFHHYLNPDKAVKEMCRLLKKGGRTYILDPTADTWLIKAVDKVMGPFDSGHVKLYSTREFQDLFAGAGLRYVATKAVNAHEKIHIGEM